MIDKFFMFCKIKGNEKNSLGVDTNVLLKLTESSAFNDVDNFTAACWSEKNGSNLLVK